VHVCVLKTGLSARMPPPGTRLCECVCECGVVWCGLMVWRGVVWCGVVWCGVVWCGVVLCGVVSWCGVVWCGVGVCKGCPKVGGGIGVVWGVTFSQVVWLIGC